MKNQHLQQTTFSIQRFLPLPQQKLLLSAVCMLISLHSIAQPPVISSFSPESGPVGTTVAIIGSNFDPTAANNAVYFGATRAAVTAASATSLTVVVPVGATYQPLTVTTNGLTGNASRPFVVTVANYVDGFAPNSFVAKKDTTASYSYPTDMGTADFDGDGKPDLVAVGNNASVLFVLKNGSTAGNVSLNRVDVAAGLFRYRVAISDINADGKPDLVTVSESPFVVSVHRNTSTVGTISFATKQDYALASGVRPRGLTIGDLDGDGRPDVAIADSTSNGKLYFFRNTSTGGTVSFAARLDYPAAGGTPLSIAIDDVDGDGKRDVIVTNYAYDPGSSKVSVLKNNSDTGAITFAGRTDFTTGSSPYSLATGDLDGDGKPEMVVANYNSNTLSVYKNQSISGGVFFAAKQDYTTGTHPYKVAISDLDGDGKPDLATTNDITNTISICKNSSTTGTVSFAARQDYATGVTPQSLCIVDVDGDGRYDLTTVYAANYLVSVLLNQVGAPVVTSFSPANAAIGTTITIRGTGFTGATAVSIGGFAAGSFTVVSDTIITAVVTAVAGGNVAVTTSRGTDFLAGFYNGLSVNAFSPASGPIGTAVTITGNNFSPVAANNIVYFGAVKATVTAASATALTVTVPVGTTYQPISVTTSNLTAYTAQPFVPTFTTVATSFYSNSFAAKRDFTTAASPVGATIADLDGDGKPDMLVPANSSVAVFKNTGGNGFLAFTTKVEYAIPSAPQNVVASDLDGDGKPEMIAASYQTEGGISVFKNNSVPGAISFSPRVAYSSELSTQAVAVGDMNGDGKPDLVTINAISNSVSVFRNSSFGGTISFATRLDFPAVASPYALSITDVDGDGKPDLVIAGLNATFSVFRNTGSNGAVSFAPRVDFATGGSFSMTTGDMDGDGKPDVVVANSGEYLVSAHRNLSTPGMISFAGRVTYATGTDPRGVAIGDLDGDGKPDIAVTSAVSNLISVLRNTSVTGSLSFDPRVDYPAATYPFKLSIGDLDGDGRPDLVVPNLNSSNVSFLRNDTKDAETCPGGSVSLPAGFTSTSYQWQVDIGSGFTNISNNANYTGATSAYLLITNAPTTWYGYRYRCVVVGAVSKVFTLQFKNYFTGFGTATWESTSNWSCRALPDSNTDVVINGTVIVESNVTCRTLRINPGAQLQVKSGYRVTITR